jgi:hypothetical protein
MADRTSEIMSHVIQEQHIDLISTWRTSNRVTEFFIEHLPGKLWDQRIPGFPRRTIRMVAGHIHDARRMWIKMIRNPTRSGLPKALTVDVLR